MTAFQHNVLYKPYLAVGAHTHAPARWFAAGAPQVARITLQNTALAGTALETWYRISPKYQVDFSGKLPLLFL